MYPVCLEDLNTEELKTFEWYNNILITSINNFLLGIDNSIQNVSKISTSKDSSSKSYCPRCLSEYTIEDGLCADCKGIHLLKNNQD